MNIKPEELKLFVENNPKLVRRKESIRHPGLFVLKYTREVFYKSLWNENTFLLECRGLVVDADYNVVVKPFTKVFNFQENGTTIDPDELCTIVRKVNGFMACATLDRAISDDLIISTTGSLDSEHVDIAYKHIKLYEENIKRLCHTKATFIFEICDINDPHIIKETEGAWLIGAYVYPLNDSPMGISENTLDSWAELSGMMRPEVCSNIPFSTVVDIANKCTHEGFMVYGQKSYTTLKIKSPHYLITKFLARASEDKLHKTIFSGNRQLAYQKMDEEFYPLVDYICSVGYMFEVLGEQDRIQVIRDFLTRSKPF